MNPIASPSPHHHFPGRSVLPPHPAASVHHATPPKLPSLPAHFAQQGIIDTIVLRIPFALAWRDLRRLEGVGWSKSTCTNKSAAGDNTGSFTRYQREVDGLRICSRHDSTTVEVSLPRVLGLGNHEQHLMTWAMTQQAISSITEKLLPWTTTVARLESSDDRELDWAALRIDITRNFSGSVASVVAAYGGARWRRSRRSASREVHKGNVKQLNWAGKVSQLLVYDKGAEMQSRKKRDRDPKVKAPARDKLGRAELRFTGAQGMARLMALTKAAGAETIQSLPLLVKCGTGKPVRREVCLDALTLHTVLHAELASLGAKRKPPETCRTVADFGILKLAEDEEAWESYQNLNAKSRTLARTRAKVGAARLQLHPCDLANLCYPDAG